MLKPNILDQKKLFTEQFEGMTDKKVTYQDLEQARKKLIETVNYNLTIEDREFLMSMKKGTPRWELLDLENIEQLPAVRWKLMNIKAMNPEKHKTMLEELGQKLFDSS